MFEGQGRFGQGERGGPVPWAGVAIVLAAIGGLLWITPVPRSDRPQVQRAFEADRFDSEDVNARLWQDPFSAVFAADDGSGAMVRSEDGPHGAWLDRLEQLRNEINAPLLKPDRRGSAEHEASSNVPVILGVMVPGEWYAEDVETRRRSRVAVLAGLGACGYRSVAAEHIGYFGVRFSRRVLGGTTQRKLFRVAYEWFETDPLTAQGGSLGSRRVLVLWINESNFGARTLHTLDQILDTLIPSTSLTAIEAFNPIRIIGPSNSSTLQAMLGVAGDESDQFDWRTDADSRIARGSSSSEDESDPREVIGASIDDPALLLEMINAYLDEPLDITAAKYDELIGAIADVTEGGGAAPRAFLEQTSWLMERISALLPDVEDSDPVWYRTVIEYWRILWLLERGRPAWAKAAAVVDGMAWWIPEGTTLPSPTGPDTEVIIDVVVAMKALDGKKVGNAPADEVDAAAIEADAAAEEDGASQEESGGSAGASVRALARIAGEVTDEEFGEIIYIAASVREVRPRTRFRYEMYSSRSTASLALLLDDSEEHTLADAFVKSGHGPFGSIDRFVRLIPDDDVVLEAIVDELRLRGVEPGRGRGHVALVGEWDTFYGKALPVSLSTAVRASGDRRVFKRDPEAFRRVMQSFVDEPLLTPKNVHTFYYMRGIDGAIPGRRAGAGVGRASVQGGDGAEQTPSRREMEQPVGPSRLDYARRLADQIGALDRRLRASGESLRAIGVTGSDVYDKQLILQVLRPRFPGVLFFTTDLDARLFHPSQYSWSRNLIIGSGFGLRLHPDLQRSIPAFRDSYQTATYLATLVAMESPRLDEHLGLSDDEPRLEGAALAEARVRGMVGALSPRLYEVSRTGVQEYVVPRGDDNVASLHAAPARAPLRVEFLGKLLLAGALAIGLALPFATTFSRLLLELVGLRPARFADLRWLAWVLVILCFVPLALAVYDARRPGGEPFEFNQGVSVWPTILVRTLVALLSVFFLVLAVSTISDSNERLERLYFGTSEDGADRVRHDRRSVRSRLQRYRRILHGRARGADRAEAGEGAAGAEDSAGSGAEPRDEEMGDVGVLRHVWALVWSWLWLLRRLGIAVWHERIVRRESRRYPEPRPRNEKKRTRGKKKRTRRAEPAEGAGEPRRDDLWARRVWRRYQMLGRCRHRFIRVGLLTALYIVFGYLVFATFGATNNPARGQLARLASGASVLIFLLPMSLLIFFVADAMRLCHQFVQAISARPTVWTMSRPARLEGRESLKGPAAAEYLDVMMVAERTRDIGRILTWPFVIIALLLLSRLGYFDDFTWPLSLLIVLVTIAAYAIASGVLLRRAAEAARERSVVRLRSQLLEAMAREQGNEPATEGGEPATEGGEAPADGAGRARPSAAEPIRVLIDEIQDLKIGAFAPWSQRPVLRAVLIPFGGAGIVALLDYLAVMGG